MINKIIIQNCPINNDDLKVTHDIIGKSIKDLKAKTVRKPGDNVKLQIEITPYGVIEIYKNVTLSDDIMFVNNIRFVYDLQAYAVCNCMNDH